jgi:hypothetical protein
MATEEEVLGSSGGVSFGLFVEIGLFEDSSLSLKTKE